MRSDWVTTALPRSGNLLLVGGEGGGEPKTGQSGNNPHLSYADLAKPALKGQLCLRDRQSPYNQSLVADQMIQRGEASTQPFFSSDTPLVRAVANGECGVGVVNTYHVARMLSGESGEADKALAQRVKVVFPNPAHVNISRGGVPPPQRILQLP